MSMYVNCSIAEAKNLSDFKGVFILGEQRDGKIQAVTFELLTWGRGIADDLGCELACVLLGDEIENMDEVILRGADKVFFIQDPIFKNFLTQPYSNAITRLVNEEKPEVIIAGATTTGRTVMPLVAAKTNTGLTADCTELTVDPDTKLLLQTRPAIGGNIMATIKTPDTRPQMATVRPRSAKQSPVDTSRTGQIIVKNYAGATTMTVEKFLEFIIDTTQAVSIEEADIIIAGGKGMKNAAGFKLIEELAELMGAAVGATRDAVELGWSTYPHQVGLSGKTVSPKLIIAAGIAGKIQFLAGMQTSDVIVAINKDPEAQIFKVADFGIVGDVFEVMPMLIETVKKIKASA
ncbi:MULTISPECIES: electron transfer flavoprotein subunit alpha/FixB family protein [Pelosinus]|uniref:Electron transfer flavoprotein alpha/beta-subunit n=1 Tax=Pelosinus fermentans B4 TaxID=1149862 RepID=I8RH68_9FIRM|nr:MULTISPECIES: electron transfer flavoprotein subunit alpha/FixB family protein [Pelosinus]EIW19048.1 Electron transfer flavoprotein alpha/beta-subunit [Pelosinus fermentans B4]EIW21742.1 Electron transfer flavoprotein alpha/beta-subunit [Pelosinus fermentans A11]OAM95410.1 Electron transfer flavoprotein alpha/beta-subunit [Pelosinus fermentans DSM 17108]SDR27696.1 electron transfer flavoprotein alpha subunit apoprotein [Pelosinus fermentans]